MYIQGINYSHCHSVFLIAGIPVDVLSIGWKLKVDKKHTWSNSQRPTSITYGKEEIEKITLKLTQQMAQAIREKSVDGKLTGIAATTAIFTARKRTSPLDPALVWQFTDLEFLNDGWDDTDSDNPAAMIAVDCIASDIKAPFGVL